VAVAVVQLILLITFLVMVALGWLGKVIQVSRLQAAAGKVVVVVVVLALLRRTGPLALVPLGLEDCQTSQARK
jgi:hypothetical protein